MDDADRPAVLVVDDEPSNRALVRAYLEQDYDLHEAADAAGAFAVLRQRPIDLVLLDVMMPDMDGFEACRMIKQMFREPYLPVVLLTALGEQHERNAGLEAGADDFLSKPVDRQELFFRVRTFIKLRRQDGRIRRQLQKLTERDRQIQQQMEELDRLARVRHKWAEELEQANKELEAFTYTVSHDLRAPLRAIDGFSEALLADQADRLDDQGRAHLARVRAATTRMSGLIEDLLDLSRITGGPLERQTVDLSEIARDVLGELGRRDPGRQVIPSVEDELIAGADQRLITIALENLLGNAWKFSAGREEAHIAVGQVIDAGENAFFVRDNGAGFDSKYVNRLFQPFQRLHSQAEFDGTGIGLATVKRIISRHGGRIWAQAVVGRGATFFFTLGEGS
jgi:two-component system, sensor histidine kinase and response regulator